MTTSEFARQLRVLNPKLRVCCFEDSDKLAGLYYVDREGYQDICGVDKNYVPEYTESDGIGHIIKSGWRRVFLILLKLGLTDARKITKVCPGFFLHWSQHDVDMDRMTMIQGDPVSAKITKYSENAPVKRWIDPDTNEMVEGSVLSADQNLEIAEDIRKKDSTYVKEEANKERWFLETWQKRGGNLSDKPKL